MIPFDDLQSAGWHTEKAKLIGALHNSNRTEIERVIDAWFRETVFQLGIIHRTSMMNLRAMEDKKAYRQAMRRHMAIKMAEEIIATEGMFTETIREDWDVEITDLRILLLGRPRVIKDKETGKLSYIRDELIP